MKLGAVAGPVYPPRDETSTAEALEAQLEMCATASAVGLDGLSVPHHYVTGPEAQVFPPLVMAGYLAARFPQMYLATTIFLLPLHHPVEIAEQVAALDQMTDGKFIFGVGQGYRLQEFSSLGLPRKTKAGRLVEACKALKVLWSGDSVSFAGEHYEFQDVTASIAPKRPGGPPIMVGADALKTVGRVPEFADYWVPSARHSRKFLREALPVYKDALAAQGKTFTGIPMTRDLCIAATKEQAIRRAKDALERQYRIQMKWGQPGENYDVSFDDLTDGRLVVGTVEDVAEELVQDAREFGAEFTWFRLWWPGMQQGDCLDVIRLLGEEVAPLVRAELGSSSILDASGHQSGGHDD